MLKTYITTVPLQGKLDPMLYQRERVEAPTATCFPIVQVMRDTLEPGDTVQLLAIRQENADTARNYQRLLEELAQLGIAEYQVRQIDLPEEGPEERLSDLLSLHQLLSSLEERDRCLIFLRYYRGKTQTEVARRLGMTQVQVSRREKKLLMKLRGFLSE